MKNNIYNADGSIIYNEDGSVSVETYKAVYENIVSLSIDADGYGLFENITDEDIEKCKWLAAIIDVIDDVPRRRVEHVFKYKKIEFDYCDFLDEQEI